MLDPRVTDTASSRVFLNILPDAALPFEQLAVRFQQIMDGGQLHVLIGQTNDQ